MHDLYEGVAPYTVQNVLQALINKKILSLSTINNRTETFNRSDNEKPNRPRPLYYTQGEKGGESLKVKQSASEMLCLTRYLGLMIEDLIPAGNQY